ncbi:unnamed protein product [Nesidiocoris tenuis]|uniref:Peptidase M12B domain-containing protein n=1 Tax=Nesidiocoris tenuis TaxID=355587 RepID=A0A6H5HR76_9HEMI|nr:unnamed protein product [Nesidiocoris tenuis]
MNQIIDVNTRFDAEYFKNGYTLYLNSGLSSSRNHYGQRVITREADLVTAHEFGHNWGSEHDPDINECSPSASQGGSYLMYTYSVSGYDVNNKRLEKRYEPDTDYMRFGTKRRDEFWNPDQNKKVIHIKVPRSPNSQAAMLVLKFANNNIVAGHHVRQASFKACIKPDTLLVLNLFNSDRSYSRPFHSDRFYQQVGSSWKLTNPSVEIEGAKWKNLIT